MRFDTKAVHAGVTPDPSTGAIMTPIFQTSTYVQQSPGNHKGFEYSRTQNPTRFALQDSIAALENARYGLVFGSGLAAIDAVIKLLKPGDEVISANDLYGGTYRIFTKVFENFGIKFHFIGMEDVANIENYVNDNTKLIWLETPTNPMMNIVDIKGAAAIAKKHNIILGVDNTFASPALQNPMDLGALAMNSDVLYQRLAFIQNSCGAVAGPQDCFLVLRGIKTLHLRMQRHCENGEKVARYLAEHPKVNKVYWPGFESHPNHAIAKEQMRGFGGMISFTFHEDDMQQSFRVMERFKVFALAESLGGVESMANHPATMTHGAIPREERMKVGLLDSLIRLSVGIEDADDLIADLEQAIG